MKEKIEKLKKDFKFSKRLEEKLKNKFLSKNELERSKKSETIKMLDLKTNILYGEKYLDIFIAELVNIDTKKKEEKYNVKRINSHLEKIFEEYTKLTNELDEIIMDDSHVCSICGKKYKGYGNNAQPVNSGICCDVCNSEIVIPRRLQERKNRKV